MSPSFKSLNNTRGNSIHNIAEIIMITIHNIADVNHDFLYTLSV